MPYGPCTTGAPGPCEPSPPEGLPAPGGGRSRLIELRALRRELQQQEADLSYVRRLLQGRIDILEAELTRRVRPDAPLLDLLPRILADSPADRHSSARHVTVGTPQGAECRRLAARMLDEVGLSDLAARTDAELAEALRRLAAYEEQVSLHRQALQHTADGCRKEIARMYREGTAHVDDLLPRSS